LVALAKHGMPVKQQKSPATQPVSALQPVGQLVLEPSQTSGVQLGLPAEPAAIGEQVPAVGAAQLPQPELHAVEQHTPLAQNPDAH
jgi:hypothetical protein